MVYILVNLYFGFKESIIKNLFNLDTFHYNWDGNGQ